MKTIKITEEQKQRLKEMLFPNGTESADTIPQYHGDRIVASGYLEFQPRARRFRTRCARTILGESDITGVPLHVPFSRLK